MVRYLFHLSDKPTRPFESTMVKRCAWGTCKTDSRYPERLIKDGKVTNFHPFQSEKDSKNLENCGFVHVAEQMQLLPTDKYSDPAPAAANGEGVCHVCVYVCIFFLYSVI